MSKNPVPIAGRTLVAPLPPVAEAVESYLLSLNSKHDETVLLEMEALAHEQRFPIVGRLVGAFLEVLTKSIAAKRVFELGSGFGYSAYWFSRGVGIDGTVICTEGDPGNVELAKKFLERVSRIQRVDYHCGWAQEIFKTHTGPFDIVYNDVDKDAYPEVWKLVKDTIRPGGFYIADNALWGGRVALMGSQDSAKPNFTDVVPGYTEAIFEHNRLIATDPDFEFFINPIRDGVIVARRKDD